jgi:hypothetical protein
MDASQQNGAAPCSAILETLILQKPFGKISYFC